MFSVYNKLPAVRSEDACDHPQKRAFSRTVGTGQAKYHALPDDAGHVVYSVDILKCFVKVFKFDHFDASSLYNLSRTAVYSG